jgi:hypothetical protein
MRELAEAIGQPQKSVQEWVTNDRLPRDLSVVKKMAEALRCSTHRVLFGEDDAASLLTSVFEKTEIHTGLYEITIKKVNPKS